MMDTQRRDRRSWYSARCRIYLAPDIGRAAIDYNISQAAGDISSTPEPFQAVLAIDDKGVRPVVEATDVAVIPDDDDKPRLASRDKIFLSIILALGTIGAVLGFRE